MLELSELNSLKGRAFGQFSSCETQRPDSTEPVEIKISDQEDMFGGKHTWFCSGRYWNQDNRNVSMGLDAMKTSHPIDVTVKSPSEIREIFDAISYDKGGCVLRMLENYVGGKKLP